MNFIIIPDVKISKNKNENKENWQNIKGALEETINAAEISSQESFLTAEQINQIIKKEINLQHKKENTKVTLGSLDSTHNINHIEEFTEAPQDLHELEALLSSSSIEEAKLEPSSLNHEIKNSNHSVTKTEAPSLTSQLNKFEPVHEQVKLVITKNIAEKNDLVTVQLEPHHLGKLEIMLNFDDNKLANLVIKAEKKEALELLQKDFKLLELNLENTGIKIADSNISFGLMSDFRQGANQQREFMENYAQVFDQNLLTREEILLNSIFKPNPNLQIDILA